LEQKQIPNSLSNFNRYLQRTDPFYLHKFLLRQIGLLLNYGWRYEEVIELKELLQLYRAIKDKLLSGNITADLGQLVTFIYSRDLSAMPFGSWVKMEPNKILAAYQISFKYKAKIQTAFHPLKLAGFILSLEHYSTKTNKYNFEVHLKNIKAKLQTSIGSSNAALRRESILTRGINSGDLILIQNPTRFYFFANINRTTFKEIAKLLNINYEYDNYNSKSESKVRLYIWGYKEVLKNYQNFAVEQTELNQQFTNGIFNKSLVFNSGLQGGNKIDWKNLSNSFISRYLNSNTWHLTRKQISNFPFYKIALENTNLFLYAPERLFNYKLAFTILFLNQTSRLKDIGFSVDRRTLLHSQKECLSVLSILKSSNVGSKHYPISSPNLDANSSLHFRQIDEIQPIINDMTEIGVHLNLDMLNKINRNKFMDWLSGKDDITLFEKYGTTDKKTIVDILVYNYEDATEELRNIKKHLGNSIDRKIIFGSFTSHKASTHRMTSHNYNLQGISKEIREQCFSAPRGWRLLNADVSGQDLVIAANLAKKLYSDPMSKSLCPDQDADKLNKQIKLTLMKLSKLRNNECRPVDFIVDKIFPEIQKEFPGYKRKQIRDYIKEILFTTFYGGGVKTIIERLRSDAELEFYSSLDSDKVKMIIKKWNLNISLKNNNTSKKFITSELLEEILEKLESKEINIHFNPDSKDPYLSWSEIASQAEEIAGPGGVDYELSMRAKDSETIMIQKDIETISRIKKYLTSKLETDLIKKLHFAFVENINNHYPGILESLNYYKNYTSINKSLSYPSLLGHQTIIEGRFPDNEKWLITRGKSYPVQISSAEFMRQWIIEIASERGYNKSFKIVNAIHDQVFVIAKHSEVDRAKRILLKTSKRASTKLGIDPNTLHLSDIVVQK